MQPTNMQTTSDSNRESAVQAPSLGWGTATLAVLTLFGVILTIYRLGAGLGASTNLNAGYPWGLWVAFKLLCVALAGAGYTIAATVYIFKLEKYHGIARPAILMGFLGYIMFVISLLLDLGLPHRIWHPLVMWQHHSVMFEISWCVSLYLVVLALEFSPAVFERLGMHSLNNKIRDAIPVMMIAALVLFTYALSHSVAWTLAVAVAVLLFQTLVWIGAFPQSPVPPLLVMAAVIFSTLHQSSLGSMFLLVPHKLNALWYTPLIPVLFFISSIWGGLGLVILGSILSSKFLKKETPLSVLSGLGKAIPYVLAVYLVIKIADIIGRGAIEGMFEPNLRALLFWIEIIVGLIIPMTLLIMPEVYGSVQGLFWSSLTIVVGLILNRVNVGLIGIEVRFWENYIPSWIEFGILIGILAGGVLAYALAVRYLPVFEDDTQHV